MKNTKITKDPRISNYDLDQFNKHGWINIDLQLDEEIIDLALNDLKLMRKKAIRSKYDYGRIYYDYLFDFNLASIELPFNKEICLDNVRHFFSKAKIGSIISNFFNSSEYTCTLARLFCMGDYNYRGVWHRDHKYKNLFDYGRNREKIEVLNVGIYLENQTGFRFLKKDYEEGFSKSIVNKQITQTNNELFFPIQPTKNSYYQIGGGKGSILVFDPNIFHQGSNQGARLDFHLKFERNYKGDKQTNSFQDFNIVPHLFEKKDLKTQNIPNNIPRVKRQKFRTRFFNTLNYSLPVYNLYKIFKNHSLVSALKNFGKPDVFSNTFFQRD